MVQIWIDNIIPILVVLKSFLLQSGIFPFVGIFIAIWVIQMFIQVFRVKVIRG